MSADPYESGLPRRIETLDAIDARFHPSYEPDGDGAGFRLTPRAAELQDQFERDVAELDRQHAEQIGELQAKRRRLDEQLVAIEVGRVLREAGVDPADLIVLTGAVAAMNPLVVRRTPDGDAVVESEDGRASVDFVVRTWLEGEIGSRYMPKRASGPGPLSQQLQALRRRLQ